MTLAFNSKHPFVPKPAKDPNATRWIASLSDGTTVFEDVTPGERSAWLRLRDYVELHGLKMTNFRLEAFGRQVVLVPYKDGEDNSQINGYWHSKSMTACLNVSGIDQVMCSGIGFLKGKSVHITWVKQDGTIFQEIRDYKKGDKALIINDPPA